MENLLNLDVTDRRRLVVAAVLTTVALPAIWLFARGESSNGTAAPAVAAAGVEVPAAGGAEAPSSSIDPFGTDGPIFVDGPTTPPKPAVIEIAVPASLPGQSMDGTATYKTDPNDPISDTCSAPNAPYNATLTITNLDNGRPPITCVNRKPRVLAGGVDIVIPTFLYQEIAQLVDAPIPVRISWNVG